MMKPGFKMEMPQYSCHKTVSALQIAAVTEEALEFNAPWLPIVVGKEWLDKHNPEVGGYYVAYKDGYTSYSPEKAFTEGYKLSPNSLSSR